MLNWNPSGPETFVINGVYSGGTISTVNAYNKGLANGQNNGFTTGIKKPGGLEVNGWCKTKENPGITSCYVYPGRYKLCVVFQTFAKYVPGYRLYLDNVLIGSWEADWSEADKANMREAYYNIPHEGTLRCEAWSSTNTNMLFIYGAMYRVYGW